MPRQPVPKAPRITISVTSELIEHSIKRDSSHCMIAEAIKDTVPGISPPSVDIQTIRFSDPKKRLRYTYLTPRIAQLAIIQFDQGKEPEPFSFQLRKAHVTTMYHRKQVSTPRGPLTVKEQERYNKGLGKMPKYPNQGTLVPDHPELTKETLVDRKGSKAMSIPDRIGGSPPPTTNIGRRRVFGLRALEY